MSVSRGSSITREVIEMNRKVVVGILVVVLMGGSFFGGYEVRQRNYVTKSLGLFDNIETSTRVMATQLTKIEARMFSLEAILQPKKK
jgi:hypothetical protein